MTAFGEHTLRGNIEKLMVSWQKNGLPGRDTLLESADALMQWRLENGISGLWQTPPQLLGATLDDAWGMGLELILKYAQVIGVETHHLGLLKPWQEILAACRTLRPDYLGLTVLQFDTEDDLITLREQLADHTKIIAGGPVFRYDPEFQQRTKIDFVAKDLIAFLHFLLAFPEQI